MFIYYYTHNDIHQIFKYRLLWYPFLLRIRIPIPLFCIFVADNNFDIPDRTFHNLATTWHLASKQSPTDVKEMIPEFYYLPEFLVNFEGKVM